MTRVALLALVLTCCSPRPALPACAELVAPDDPGPGELGYCDPADPECDPQELECEPEGVRR